MRRPLVAISGVPAQASWGFWSQPAVLTAQTYLDAVTRAGGQPLILVPSLDADIDEFAELVAGIVLAGGTDVGPEHYGETATARMEETHDVRDVFELRLARAAQERDIPVLGICRGLQILNVAAGGTLHQHLVDSGYGQHRPAPGRLDESTHHAVRVTPGSLLARCGLADLRNVNSHHHQGVASIGRGGRVAAVSLPDHGVEAIEWPERRFSLGVQWHPEDPAMDDLFRAFVSAASAARRSRSVEERVS